jgi:GMP synthase-like glutamine amidotransferase
MGSVSMRVLVIENYPGTPLGLVGVALAEAGASIDTRRAFAGEPLPASDADHDGLIILGGGQSALDDADHPYLPALASLSRAFGTADKAVLGICLGAQLVARGHGGDNLLDRPIEFGWHPVRPTAAGFDDPVMSELGAGAPVFHWHTDTFSLPPGAAHLAASDRTELQAFRVGRAVYGVQFHFEADRDLVSRWNVGFAEEIAGHSPDWHDRHPAEAALHGARADAIGLAIARAWVSVI